MTAAETVNVTRECPGCGRLVVWAGTRAEGRGDGTVYRTDDHNCAPTKEKR